MEYEKMDKSIGAVLKRYRTERRLSLRDVGEMLQVNNSTVSRWESGENAISAKDLLHYVDLLGFSYDQFLDDFKNQ